MRAEDSGKLAIREDTVGHLNSTPIRTVEKRQLPEGSESMKKKNKVPNSRRLSMLATHFDMKLRRSGAPPER